jgi:hypothetical protein
MRPAPDEIEMTWPELPPMLERQFTSMNARWK